MLKIVWLCTHRSTFGYLSQHIGNNTNNAPPPLLGPFMPLKHVYIRATRCGMRIGREVRYFVKFWLIFKIYISTRIYEYAPPLGGGGGDLNNLWCHNSRGSMIMLSPSPCLGGANELRHSMQASRGCDKRTFYWYYSTCMHKLIFTYLGSLMLLRIQFVPTKILFQ
jgi:hypothetical protein